MSAITYDRHRRRLWIGGQRCHHGATGSLVAAAAFLRLIRGGRTDDFPRLIAIAGALMAHDWKDRGIWFERGYGSQL